jgi:NADH-quinone oxidoreductase subunit E
MPESIDLRKMEILFQKYAGQEGSLIPILQETQSLYGYLPEEVLVHISRALKISISRIYGVVTFYAQFYLTPRGRHSIRVCRGTACHVRGGRSILNRVKEYLRIEEGETTKDLNFSLETVACLGTCFLAPVMMLGRDYYGKLVPQRIPTIIDQYLKGRATDE